MGLVTVVFFLPRVSLHTLGCARLFSLSASAMLTRYARAFRVPSLCMLLVAAEVFLRRLLADFSSAMNRLHLGGAGLVVVPADHSRCSRLFFTQAQLTGRLFWRSAFLVSSSCLGGLFAAVRPLYGHAPSRDGRGHARSPVIYPPLYSGCSCRRILPGAGKPNSSSSVIQGAIFVAMLPYALAGRCVSEYKYWLRPMALSP